MNRATIAGIVQKDPVLDTAPTGEKTLTMRVVVPGMGRGAPGSIAVREYGDAAEKAAEALHAGDGVLVDGRMSHMTIGHPDGAREQHYELVGRAQEVPLSESDQDISPAIRANRVAFTGRLTQDPELRSTPGGTSMCRMRIAVDGMGAEDRDAPGFINVTEFGKQGEASARRLTKGWLVAFDGRLDHQVWETDDQPRETHAVIGRVEHLSPPRANGDRDREQDRARGQEGTVDPRTPGAASRTPVPGLPGAATEQLAASGAGVGIGDDIPF
jgi:single-strand DNA-binding protein